MKALMAVLILGLLTSCSRTDGGSEKTSVIAHDAPPLVPTVKVGRIDLVNDLVLTAEFEPFQQVDLMAKVSGYVRSISVDIGDRVRAGQVLATLEIPEMEDDLTRRQLPSIRRKPRSSLPPMNFGAPKRHTKWCIFPTAVSPTF